MAKLARPPKALSAPPKSKAAASNSDLLHWARSVRSLRHGQAWSQTELAGAIGTTQAVVSRWERGESIPSPPMRKKILALSENIVPKELVALIEVVAHSPFPMILTDQKHMILSASKSSGLKKNVNLFSQTPPDEIAHLRRFSEWLEREQFWTGKRTVFNYAVNINGESRKAVVNAISAGGAYYALVQKVE